MYFTENQHLVDTNYRAHSYLMHYNKKLYQHTAQCALQNTSIQ
jgi:hypothetical protein